MARGALTMFGALTALFAGSNCATTAQEFDTARRRMVETQLQAEGISSSAVLQAMARVPRHLFVPPELRDRAYENSPLPIGLGQTISQPYIVAYMTEALQVTRDHTVLEIGTGSGYQAAILAHLARKVCTIEIIPPLAEAAAKTLRDLAYDNVSVRLGDGFVGWPECGPFDAIVVTAALGEVPPPLIEQLKVGGRLVMPVGAAYTTQQLTVVEKTAPDKTTTRAVALVRFVPFTRSQN